MKPEGGQLQSDFEKRWRERFEEFATLRDDDAGIAGWSASGLAVRFRHFLRAWQNSGQGKSWLDAGCGAGTYSRYLASLGLNVVGLDYCLPAAAKARARDTWNCRWAVADVTRLPLRPGGFDGVICFGVIQALARSEPAVRELVAQLKDGGEIWVDALNGLCVVNVLQRLSRRLRGKPVHLRYESPRRMRRLMEDAGLVKLRIHWIPIMPARLKAFQPVAESALVTALLRNVPWLGALLSHSFMLTGAYSTANRALTPRKSSTSI